MSHFLRMWRLWWWCSLTYFHSEKNSDFESGTRNNKLLITPMKRSNHKATRTIRKPFIFQFPFQHCLCSSTFFCTSWGLSFGLSRKSIYKCGLRGVYRTCSIYPGRWKALTIKLLGLRRLPVYTVDIISSWFNVIISSSIGKG